MGKKWNTNGQDGEMEAELPYPRRSYLCNGVAVGHKEDIVVGLTSGNRFGNSCVWELDTLQLHPNGHHIRQGWQGGMRGTATASICLIHDDTKVCRCRSRRHRQKQKLADFVHRVMSCITAHVVHSM